VHQEQSPRSISPGTRTDPDANSDLPIGAAWFEFEAAMRLEFGYRLVPRARGHGYATEASLALLAVASESFRGEVLAMIDPRNMASKGVIGKLGFEFWKIADIDGYRDELYRRSFS
jgi:RimJ/RimL family protein N-acetyltransferase